MSDYCLYPNQCGPGVDCSLCHLRRIKELESALREAVYFLDIEDDDYEDLPPGKRRIMDALKKPAQEGSK